MPKTPPQAADIAACLRPELVVIPCGSRKLDHPARAADLYTGSYHCACSRAARTLRPERLLILSARYGLVDPDEVIEPYDTPHGAADAVTAPALLDQARTGRLLDLDPVVALGGRRHVELVRAVWPHALDPLAGTGGMGAQIARMGRWSREAEPLFDIGVRN